MTIQVASNAHIDVDVEALTWSTAVPDIEDIVAEAAAATLGREERGGVAILLTDDETVRDLNARFRAKDAPTNVLSFPSLPNPEGHLGDIALAFGVCEREARTQGKRLTDHLRHLVVHGVLHLLGYDHEESVEAAAMEARERELLGGLGVGDPYGPQAGHG